LKDLIDDAPIEESEGEDSDASGGEKRKKSDDELDDRLEDEDYDLIEENLGVKVERRVSCCLRSRTLSNRCRRNSNGCGASKMRKATGRTRATRARTATPSPWTCFRTT
jgi:hypothetical protein